MFSSAHDCFCLCRNRGDTEIIVSSLDGQRHETGHTQNRRSVPRIPFNYPRFSPEHEANKSFLHSKIGNSHRRRIGSRHSSSIFYMSMFEIILRFAFAALVAIVVTMAATSICDRHCDCDLSTIIVTLSAAAVTEMPLHNPSLLPTGIDYAAYNPNPSAYEFICPKGHVPVNIRYYLYRDTFEVSHALYGGGGAAGGYATVPPLPTTTESPMPTGGCVFVDYLLWNDDDAQYYVEGEDCESGKLPVVGVKSHINPSSPSGLSHNFVCARTPKIMCQSKERPNRDDLDVFWKKHYYVLDYANVFTIDENNYSPTDPTVYAELGGPVVSWRDDIIITGKFKVVWWPYYPGQDPYPTPYPMDVTPPEQITPEVVWSRYDLTTCVFGYQYTEGVITPAPTSAFFDGPFAAENFMDNALAVAYNLGRQYPEYDVDYLSFESKWPIVPEPKTCSAFEMLQSYYRNGTVICVDIFSYIAPENDPLSPSVVYPHGPSFPSASAPTKPAVHVPLFHTDAYFGGLLGRRTEDYFGVGGDHNVGIFRPTPHYNPKPMDASCQYGERVISMFRWPLASPSQPNFVISCVSFDISTMLTSHVGSPYHFYPICKDGYVLQSFTYDYRSRSNPADPPAHCVKLLDRRVHTPKHFDCVGSCLPYNAANGLEEGGSGHRFPIFADGSCQMSSMLKGKNRPDAIYKATEADGVTPFPPLACVPDYDDPANAALWEKIPFTFSRNEDGSDDPAVNPPFVSAAAKGGYGGMADDGNLDFFTNKAADRMRCKDGIVMKMDANFIYCYKVIAQRSAAKQYMFLKIAEARGPDLLVSGDWAYTCSAHLNTMTLLGPSRQSFFAGFVLMKEEAEYDDGGTLKVHASYAWGMACHTFAYDVEFYPSLKPSLPPSVADTGYVDPTTDPNAPTPSNPLHCPADRCLILPYIQRPSDGKLQMTCAGSAILPTHPSIRETDAAVASDSPEGDPEGLTHPEGVPYAIHSTFNSGPTEVWERCPGGAFTHCLNGFGHCVPLAKDLLLNYDEYDINGGMHAIVQDHFADVIFSTSSPTTIEPWSYPTSSGRGGVFPVVGIPSEEARTGDTYADEEVYVADGGVLTPADLGIPYFVPEDIVCPPGYYLHSEIRCLEFIPPAIDFNFLFPNPPDPLDEFMPPIPSPTDPFFTQILAVPPENLDFPKEGICDDQHIATAIVNGRVGCQPFPYANLWDMPWTMYLENGFPYAPLYNFRYEMPFDGSKPRCISAPSAAGATMFFDALGGFTVNSNTQTVTCYELYWEGMPTADAYDSGNGPAEAPAPTAPPNPPPTETPAGPSAAPTGSIPASSSPPSFFPFSIGDDADAAEDDDRNNITTAPPDPSSSVSYDPEAFEETIVTEEPPDGDGGIRQVTRVFNRDRILIRIPYALDYAIASHPSNVEVLCRQIIWFVAFAIRVRKASLLVVSMEEGSTIFTLELLNSTSIYNVSGSTYNSSTSPENAESNDPNSIQKRIIEPLQEVAKSGYTNPPQATAPMVTTTTTEQNETLVSSTTTASSSAGNSGGGGSDSGGDGGGTVFDPINVITTTIEAQYKEISSITNFIAALLAGKEGATPLAITVTAISVVGATGIGLLVVLLCCCVTGCPLYAVGQKHCCKPQHHSAARDGGGGGDNINNENDGEIQQRQHHAVNEDDDDDDEDKYRVEGEQGGGNISIGGGDEEIIRAVARLHFRSNNNNNQHHHHHIGIDGRTRTTTTNGSVPRLHNNNSNRNRNPLIATTAVRFSSTRGGNSGPTPSSSSLSAGNNNRNNAVSYSDDSSEGNDNTVKQYSESEDDDDGGSSSKKSESTYEDDADDRNDDEDVIFNRNGQVGDLDVDDAVDVDEDGNLIINENILLAATAMNNNVRRRNRNRNNIATSNTGQQQQHGRNQQATNQENCSRNNGGASGGGSLANSAVVGDARQQAALALFLAAQSNRSHWNDPPFGNGNVSHRQFFTTAAADGDVVGEEARGGGGAARSNDPNHTNLNHTSGSNEERRTSLRVIVIDDGHDIADLHHHDDTETRHSGGGLSARGEGIIIASAFAALGGGGGGNNSLIGRRRNLQEPREDLRFATVRIERVDRSAAAPAAAPTAAVTAMAASSLNTNPTTTPSSSNHDGNVAPNNNREAEAVHRLLHSGIHVPRELALPDTTSEDSDVSPFHQS